MTVVVRHLTYALQPDGQRGSVLFQYDPAIPFEVVLNFGARPTDGDEVIFHVERGILADGLTKESGIGDVRCWTCAHGYHIALTSEDGNAILRFDPDAVRAFLADAEDLVPYGAESVDFDIELAKLLIGGP